jgi:hypothetical protein
MTEAVCRTHGCRQMLRGTPQQRQLCLTLLVQLPAKLLAGSAGVLGRLEGEAGDSNSLWSLLRSCLCDPEAANRKRAAYLLNLAVMAPCLAPSGAGECAELSSCPCPVVRHAPTMG